MSRQRAIGWPFVQMNDGPSLALLFDERYERLLVTLLNYKVSTVVSLAEPENPQSVDSSTVIALISDSSGSVFIYRKWQRVSCKQSAMVIFMAASEASFYNYAFWHQSQGEICHL